MAARGGGGLRGRGCGGVEEREARGDADGLCAAEASVGERGEEGRAQGGVREDGRDPRNGLRRRLLDLRGAVLEEMDCGEGKGGVRGEGWE